MVDTAMLELNQILTQISYYAGIDLGSVYAVKLDTGEIGINHHSPRGVAYLFTGDMDACWVWLYSQPLSYFEPLSD